MGDVDAFLGDVRASLGAEAVVTDPDLVAPHLQDWTRRWVGTAPAVLRPVSTAAVAEVVRAARRHHVALVPQGGNTGLVGGATPLGGEVVVDLRRLDRLEPVDPDAAQVTVGAGTTLARLQEHVGRAGLRFPVDLAARDTATVGGMVATNAGGLHVLRHGAMRAQVVGLEAVLGTGEVVEVNPRGLLKDNTGYDLAGVLCGSEGTLAIVTSVRLRLVPEPSERVVALVAMRSVAHAVAALPALRARRAVESLELVLPSALQAVADHLGEPTPFTPAPPATLLVELTGGGDLLSELADLLAAIQPGPLADAVAADGTGIARLWRWREAVPEAVARLGIVHKADVTVPVGALAELTGAVPAVVASVAPGASTFVYGHLGDGNLHVNVVGPAADDDRVLDAVLELTLQLGGSVSAEHGIGTAKRGWLVRQRGEAAVSAMRAIKSALDPDGVLNPGVLLPPA